MTNAERQKKFRENRKKNKLMIQINHMTQKRAHKITTRKSRESVR
jgi:hypothetical protein